MDQHACPRSAMPARPDPQQPDLLAAGGAAAQTPTRERSPASDRSHDDAHAVASVVARTVASADQARDENLADNGVALWERAPDLAFARWAGERRPSNMELAAHSVEQYQAMWHAYSRWLTDHGVLATQASAEHIDRFLRSKQGRNGAPAAKTTRRRYLQMLNKVYEHLCLIELREDNPAEPLVSLQRHQGFVKPAPTVLPLSLADRFIEWTLAQSTQHWCDARNQALRLAFACAGLTTAQAQSLHPHDLYLEGETLVINVPESAQTPAHATPVSPAARDAMLGWATRLRRIAPAISHLFPARESCFGRDGPLDQAVSAVECFDVTRSALLAIGYDRPRQGPQTLRNTFIARQLHHQVPVDRIMLWAGLRTSDTIERISKVTPLRADGVAAV